MTIDKALKSGRPYRRPIARHLETWYRTHQLTGALVESIQSDLKNDCVLSGITHEDLMADDWEILEPEKDWTKWAKIKLFFYLHWLDFIKVFTGRKDQWRTK